MKTKLKQFAGLAKYLSCLAIMIGMAFATLPHSAVNAADGHIISIDGSSTVYPITEAVAEEFQKANRSIKVTVGISGTGGGFKKFCRGETQISDASRPIKSSEVEACRAERIRYIEIPVAFDGLAIMVNTKNDWVDHVTVKELKKLWEPEAQGKVMLWSDIREGWPQEEIHLFGPGVDSGTYDYFTEAIVGKEHSSRGDFTASEDDNVLVQGIATDRLALGFFGLAYYEHNKDKLKLVAVDNENDADGQGPILPTFETVANGTYKPLARPIFIYVSAQASENQIIQEFVKFYIANTMELVKEVGYIPLPQTVHDLVLKRFEQRKFGSVYFDKDKAKGKSLEQLLSA